MIVVFTLLGISGCADIALNVASTVITNKSIDVYKEQQKETK
jgi:hypothetical protein